MTYRIQHKFWLDVDRDEEAAINDEVVYLKKRRSFAATIRDGIRLMADLRRGNLDVLLELFPWVRAEIAEDTLSRVGGNGGETAAIQRQLQALEKLLMSQNNGALMAPVASQAGPKPMNVVKMPAPVDDDLDGLLVVSKAKDIGGSAATFLNSAFSLQQ